VGNRSIFYVKVTIFLHAVKSDIYDHKFNLFLHCQLDETSRALLMKMLDDATQQTLLKQAKVIYFCASNYEKASFALHFLILCVLGKC
jgi:hypothetical protein